MQRENTISEVENVSQNILKNLNSTDVTKYARIPMRTIPETQ